LSVSANYAAQEAEEGDEEPAEIGRWALAFSFAVAIGFAVMLFKVRPALLVDLLPISSGGWFVIVEGLIRVTIFVLYLTVLSFIPSLRRVFQYHAAEHKAINAYEAGEDLTPEVTQRYSLIHPRCGTAFLLWVMVIGVFVFALFGRPAWYWLIVSRIALLPAIAGIAYELIRFAGKHAENRVLMTLLAPGLWLQRLTAWARSARSASCSSRSTERSRKTGCGRWRGARSSRARSRRRGRASRSRWSCPTCRRPRRSSKRAPRAKRSGRPRRNRESRGAR